MFDQFKAMGALASLMKDKDRLRRVGEQTKAALEASRVVGEAGGGAVRVTMSGRMQVISVELDPALCAGLAAGDSAREMAQSLITEATNEAAQKAQALMESMVAKASRELGLPDMPGLTGLLNS